MELVDFHKAADQLLEFISDKIESSSDDIDVELLQGVMSIELPDGKQYVINKHEPSRQIWLSSPFSGASRFSYSAPVWQNTQKINIISLLNDEFKDYGVKL